MSSSLSLRPESDPSIYIYRHWLKKVDKIIDAMTISTLTSQRQHFTDLNVFIFCFDCFAAQKANTLSRQGLLVYLQTRVFFYFL